MDITGTASDKIVEMGLAYIRKPATFYGDDVLENLRLGAYNRRARPKVSDNLELVFSLFPGSTSERSDSRDPFRGESRMLAVGRGLMSDAKLLLIDEPPSGCRR